MKKILTLLLASVTTLAVAQKKSDRNSDADCKKLSIRVSGTIDGKDIDFDKSFDLSGMTFETNASTSDMYSSDKWEQGIQPAPDPHGKTFAGLDKSDFRKHVKYNSATGELFMQYHFKKNDEEFVYEKTVNAADKSEQERRAVIEKFEKEIGLPCNQVDM